MTLIAVLPALDRERVAHLLDASEPDSIVATTVLDGGAVYVALRLGNTLAGSIIAQLGDPDHARDFAHRLGELLALSVTRNRQADVATAALLRKVGRTN